MKRVKKRLLRTKKLKQNKVFDIKKTLAFKLLMIFLFVLIFLVIVYVLLYEPKEKEKEKGLGGELGTLCIFCSENPIVLEVLSYTRGLDNLSITVLVNWNAGNISFSDFNALLIDFEMNEGVKCNYTINSGLPEFGETINYLVSNFNPGCPEIDFSNVTNVLAYAEVKIHLTQREEIPEIKFYKDDSRNNLLYLNNYFYALTEINYSVVESPDNSKIEVVVNNFTKNISISILDGTWFGSQQFNLTAITEDGDNLTTMFMITVIDDTRIILNYEPEFDEDECGEFSWEKNTNKTIDMDSCWSDEDGDNLNYGYGVLNDYRENISIFNLSGNRLVFVPGLNFNGSTYLTFYANDSHTRVSHRAYLYIFNNNTQNSSPVDFNLPINELELRGSNPAGSEVSFFVNEAKLFSIIAENYELVEWYVDGVLVKEGVLSYVFEEKRPGIYNIEVRILNSSFIEKKVWMVSIEEDEYIEERIFDVEIGWVVFYSIIVVLIIIIFLIIWLLIIERKRRTRKMSLGFGMSVVPNRGEFNESSKQFNIPKD
jgi:hypothetical protein